MTSCGENFRDRLFLGRLRLVKLRVPDLRQPVTLKDRPKTRLMKTIFVEHWTF